MDIARFNIVAKQKKADNAKFLNSLRRLNPRKLDDAFHQAHDEVFENTDCLKCANCCKTTSPIFYQNDIERLAKFLRIRPGDFVDRYLRVDEDDDYVLKSSPCAFLGADNCCTVYDARPKACREYPHTDRKKMIQILDLTLKNTTVCPAVFEIVERLRNAP